MKKILTASVLALALTGILTNCTKTSKSEEVSAALNQDEMSLVAAAGFDKTWAEKTPEGKYLIEGDILLSEAQLQQMAGKNPQHNFVVANEEHYRTFEMVSTAGGIRTITVSLGAGFPSHYSTGLDQALARYNSYGLSIRFQRVSSGGNIHISGANLGRSFGGGCILGQAAGFPTGGNPAPGFTLSTTKCATSYINTANKADEVIAHEIGHCIGFRHTDYVNRASCGGSGESAGTIGAVHIAGTPTTVSGTYNSWMMACTNGDPVFNAEDVTALKTVYP